MRRRTTRVVLTPSRRRCSPRPSRSGPRSVRRGRTPRRSSSTTSDWRAREPKEIVSVHISSELSGTFESAQLAARRATVPVTVVDSRQVGMGTGYAVLAAAEAIAEGVDAVTAGKAARTGPRTPPRCSTSTPWSTSAAADGWAPRPPCWARRWRSSRSSRSTTGRSGRSRRSVRRPRRCPGWRSSRWRRRGGRGGRGGRASGEPGPGHAAGQSSRRAAQNGLGGREIDLGEIGAVLGAHVGPGMVAVAVSRRG